MAYTFSTSERQKVVFYTFDLEMCFAPQHRALFRHLKVVRDREFYTFVLEMCFTPRRRAPFWHRNFQKWSDGAVFCTFWLGNVLSPQQRALFRHVNFQKWSENGVLCTIWLGHVLRATAACNFSSLIWPNGSAPAALASLLFDPLEPQIIGKTQWTATFLPFRAPASSFFSLFLLSDLLTSSLLLSDSSHLCFSICPYCRKFDF